MKIKKKFNNNVILVEDDHGFEQVLIGKAISFDKKIGDTIDANIAEKRYLLDQSSTKKEFENVLDNVAPQYLFLASKIIHIAEAKLKCELSSSTLIGLTDHIDYAIKRAKENLTMANALLWEIKRFYPVEYACAKEGIELIHHYENVWLSDDEAGYIALHLVNGQQNQDMQDTYKMTEVVKQVIKIITFHFNISLDENSMNYGRLVTHLKYFSMRALKKESVMNITDGEMLSILMDKYPDVYACVKKIGKYLEKSLDFKMNDEEYTYLKMHVIRVVKK